ncbi:hypothetical protein ACFX2C_008681 [Malus domestica]
MPTPVLHMHSPFEKLYHPPPRLDHLRVFGCACYPILKPYKHNKLEPKTTQCIFLGYAAQYKGYICYAIRDHKLIVSRHVVFDEDTFPSLPGSVSSSPSLAPSIIPHPNTFQHPSFIPIPFPHSPFPYFSSHTTYSPSVTQSSSSIPGDLVSSQCLPTEATVSQSVEHAAINPDVTTSQVQALHHVPVSQINTHPMQTRSKSGILKKNALLAQVQSSSITEPQSFKVVVQSPEWIQAMDDEMAALVKQKTWRLVHLPPNKNLVGCKWIYKIKSNPDGSVARYKARFVAKGFSQEAGLDYHETFSPVVKPTTVRLLLSLAATKRWKLKQLDVKNVFLHGFLDEEVYMSQPQGFIDPAHLEFVCKLNRSLYGLKQASRAWNDRFSRFLLTLGFKSSYADSSLYVKQNGPSIIVLLLYVDDIILSGDYDTQVQAVIDQLTAEFDMNDLGILHYFISLQIDYRPTGFLVHQTKYVTNFLTKTNMLDCKPCTTHCHPNQKLLNHGSPFFHDPGLYRSIVGALQYLTFTGPDIAY